MKNKLKVVTNFCFRDRDCRGAERCFVAVAIVEKFPLQRFRNQNKTMKVARSAYVTPKSPVFAEQKVALKINWKIQTAFKYNFYDYYESRFFECYKE